MNDTTPLNEIAGPNGRAPARPSRELLRFENATLGYGKRVILRDLDFAVSAGDYLAIVGSNGSGKTTLLRSMLGLVRPIGGRIRNMSGMPLHYGYVPQLQTVDEIFPLTVLEVVLMGRYKRLGLIRRPGSEDRDRAASALEEVGIGHMTHRLYRELSGGQKQRTLVSRALVTDPDLLVLDEHTNDLDIAAEKAIMGLIDHLHNDRHLAVVMVTHSLNTVANHAHSIGLISNEQCRFAGVDTILDTDFLREFYGVPLRVIESDGSKVVAF